MDEYTPKTDTVATHAQSAADQTPAPLQPWTKPGFEQMPLKDALTGAGQFTVSDFPNYKS